MRIAYSEKPAGGQQGAPGRQARAAMLLIVSCTKSSGSGREVRIQVRNLSATGLGGVCRGHGSFSPGEAVSVTFRNLSPIAAKVVWFSGAEIGLAFDRPLDLERLADARNWNGPTFRADDFHRIADKCWRPGIAADLVK